MRCPFGEGQRLKHRCQMGPGQRQAFVPFASCLTEDMLDDTVC